MSAVEKNPPAANPDTTTRRVRSLSSQDISNRSLPNNADASRPGHVLGHFSVLTPRTGHFDLPEARSQVDSKSNISFASEGISDVGKSNKKTKKQES